MTKDSEAAPSSQSPAPNLARLALRVGGEPVWLGITVLIGLFLLRGRYEWTPDVARFSLRGYLSSAYLFAITVPTAFFLLRAFLPGGRRLVWCVVGAMAAFFSLPYHWLGLDRFYYYLERPLTYGAPDTGALPLFDEKPPVTNWLPGAWGRLADMPNEAAFFICLIAAGILAALICLRWIRRRARQPACLRNDVWLGLVLYLLILLQTYLHLSLRSPSVYTSYYSHPRESAYLYVEYMYPSFQGAVNADISVFAGLEQHFLGTPRELLSPDIRRAFPFYFSGQFSYFIGMYGTFILINIVLWTAASCCAYLLGRTWWNAEVGRYMAFFVASGTGFVWFVGDPAHYLAGYAAPIVLIYSFERLVVNKEQPMLGRHLLFGCLLGLGSLVYDHFNWYVFYILYGLVRRNSIGWLLLSLVVALAVYQGFLWIQTGILQLEPDTTNTSLLGESLAGIVALLSQAPIGRVYQLTMNLLGAYLNLLARAFFVVPLVLAFCGILSLREHSKVIALSGLLLTPTFLLFLFLYYGNATFSGLLLSSFARLYYPAHLGIYLLASAFLSQARGLVSGRAGPWVGALVVWLLLGVVFLLSNIDAFGFLPQLYYHFYFADGYFE